MGDGVQDLYDFSANVYGGSLAPKEMCAKLKDGSIDCWGGILNNMSSADNNSFIRHVFTANLGIQRVVRTRALDDHKDKFCGVPIKGPLSCVETTNGEDFVVSTFDQIDSANIDDLQTIGDGACALLKSGQVQCWGNGTKVALGNGGTGVVSQPTAIAIPNGLKVLKLQASRTGNSCVITSNSASPNSQNSVYCWGPHKSAFPGYSENDKASLLTPALMNSLSGAKEITDKCAILGDNSVVCWGNGDSGRLGTGHLKWWSSEPHAVSNSVRMKGLLLAGKNPDDTMSYRLATLTEADSRAVVSLKVPNRVLEEKLIQFSSSPGNSWVSIRGHWKRDDSVPASPYGGVIELEEVNSDGYSANGYTNTVPETGLYNVLKSYKDKAARSIVESGDSIMIYDNRRNVISCTSLTCSFHLESSPLGPTSDQSGLPWLLIAINAFDVNTIDCKKDYGHGRAAVITATCYFPTTH